MIQFDYTIKHPVGLYASLADGLVNIANRFESEVYVLYGNKQVSMKSLMGVISLGVPYNGKIHIQIEGIDQNEMKQTIDLFLEDLMSFFY